MFERFETRDVTHDSPQGHVRLRVLSAGIDRSRHDRADRSAGHRLQLPLHGLWGARGTVGKCFDVLALWRDVATRVSGGALDCGHYIAEEQPSALLDDIDAFFGDKS